MKNRVILIARGKLGIKQCQIAAAATFLTALRTICELSVER
jgi:hypothetical protein